MTIKIIIAEDHELTMQGIVFGLSKQKNLKVIGTATNGKSVLNLIQELKPDIVLMDIGMPVMSGIEAAKESKKTNPETKIIMLTSHSEKEKVLNAFSAGADAYCMKDIKQDHLHQVIEMVNNGAIWLDPAVAGYLSELMSNNNNNINNKNEKTTDFNLTQREQEILKLISEGLTNKNISEKLYLSIYTVKNHVSKIIQKLAVDDRTQAAILALNERII